MFGVGLFSLLVVTILYLFQSYKKWKKKFSALDRIPGPRNFPLIGNVWLIASVPKYERMNAMASLIEKHGRLFKLWIGNIPVIICTDAKDAEIILNSRVNIEKSIMYNFLVSWLGTGLLISGGSKWQQRRKLLTPAFHFSILESFLPVITEHSKVFVEKLKRLESEEESNIFPYINKYTLDVICETAMGVKLNIQESESSQYLENVLKMSNIFMKRLVRPWWYIDRLYSFSNLYKEERKAIKILHDMSMSVIQSNKQRRKEKNIDSGDNSNTSIYEGKNRKAFLDLLLDISEDSQVQFTDEDIREEVNTFMFEGHDTTASGVASTIYLLSRHPDVQDKVAEELHSVFGKSDRDPTLQDLSKLKYLECVIKESQRLFPPVPIIARNLSEDVILGSNYLIPAGTIVEVNIYRIHRQTAYYPEPEKFDPNNFLSESSRNRSPFAFIPFSAGPRNCIGQKFAMLEEKVVISSLLRKYEFKSSQTIEDLKLNIELVIRFDGGIRVKITPRIWKD